MNLVQIEDTIIQAVSNGFDYFKTVNKSRKVSFDEMKLPAFCLEAPEIENNTSFNPNTALNIKMTAYVICKNSDSDLLLEKLLEIIKFIKFNKFDNSLKTIFINTIPADFTQELPNSYVKAINFDCITVI